MVARTVLFGVFLAVAEDNCSGGASLPVVLPMTAPFGGLDEEIVPGRTAGCAGVRAEERKGIKVRRGNRGSRMFRCMLRGRRILLV